MIYKQLALSQAIEELGSMEFMLGRITDEPEVTQALIKIKEAREKLMAVEKGVADHLEEHR